MFLPPFGALLSKWMAVEASARLPLVVLMLAIGSALTMVFWGRWLGLLMTSVISEKSMLQEEQSGLVRILLVSLAVMAVVVSFVAPGLYTSMVLLLLERFYAATNTTHTLTHSNTLYIWTNTFRITLAQIHNSR